MMDIKEVLPQWFLYFLIKSFLVLINQMVKSGIMPNQELASQHVYQFDKKYINLINCV